MPRRKQRTVRWHFWLDQMLIPAHATLYCFGLMIAAKQYGAVMYMCVCVCVCLCAGACMFTLCMHYVFMYRHTYLMNHTHEYIGAKRRVSD